MRLLSSAFLGLVAAAAVSSVDASTVLKESLRSGVPAEWRDAGVPRASHPITLHIAVKQQHVPELTDALMERADPSSPLYARHMSFDQVNEMTAPTARTLDTVLRWLNDDEDDEIAIVGRSPNSDWLQVSTTVARAQQLLHAEYRLYRHTTTGQTVMRTTSYQLPEHVAAHVDFVGPTVRFPAVHPPKVRDTPKLVEPSSADDDDDDDVVATDADSAAAAGKCGLSVDPACLRTLYNTADYKIQAKDNSVAVTGYLEQYISLTDLQTFFKKYDAGDAGAKPTIIGPNVQTQPGIEASLDIQYVMAMSAGTPATFEYTAGRQPNSTIPDNEPFLAWLMNLASNPNPPLVYSTSYGDNENTVNFDYSERVNTEFVKAGARGISLLYSSGDGGVAGGQSGSCTTFIPTFPAGSPYVTAVGATQSSNPETAASFSSGGFANYGAQPSYQTQAVINYLTKFGTKLPPANRYNASGRGFPDVAAQGVDFEIVVSGFTSPVSGTSASSPTFAGIVGLLNDVRLAAGKSSLGFLNPLFYSNADAFNDITTGNNPGCGTNGFYAATGWDPVTGLGTPDFKKLSDVVLALP